MIIRIISRGVNKNRPFGRPGHMVQNILVSKVLSGTSKTKAGALFWKSHCATCSQACVILYHVAGSSKGPIGVEGNSVREIT